MRLSGNTIRGPLWWAGSAFRPGSVTFENHNSILDEAIGGGGQLKEADCNTHTHVQQTRAVDCQNAHWKQHDGGGASSGGGGGR